MNPDKEQLDAQAFARVLSHDLGSLVRTARQLSGYVRDDILREDVDSAMHALGMLDIRLANLDRFVADLISYYRAGQRAVNLEQFNLSHVVREVFQQLRMPATARLHMSSSHDLVLTDLKMIRLVLTELFNNAVIHHHDVDSLEISVDVSRTPDNRSVIIVRDNGPGIEPSIMDRVFEPFVRHTERTNPGLGLATCRRELAAVSGEICAQATNEGTAIALILPTLADLPQQSARPKILPLDDEEPRKPNLHIV